MSDEKENRIYKELKVEPETVHYCLHLAAFGCEQCKAIVRQEILRERENCAKIVEKAACTGTCFHAVCGGHRRAAKLIRESQ